MKLARGNYLICLSALLTAPLPGQTASPQELSVGRQRNSAATMEESVGRQRDSAAIMEKSIVRQRESLQRQTGPSAGNGFFVLPRAASMGTDSAPVVSATTAPPVSLCDPLSAGEVATMVGQTADREGLSPDLLRSVMQQESAFRPCAVSPKGAMGLMQLMPATAEQFGIDNPFDPESNLDAGARLLKQLLSRYGGDVPKALGAYNAGPAKVDASGGVPQIPETVDYIKQILALMPGK